VIFLPKKFPFNVHPKINTWGGVTVVLPELAGGGGEGVEVII
jgi:hypothetical protein